MTASERPMIESRQNERIVRARKLLLHKERRETGLHLIESAKLVQEALTSGARVRTLYLESGYDFPAPPETETISVSRSVLESLCESKTPQGVCAVVETPDLTPPVRYPEGLIIMLDGVQDPGNLGAILRSADAFGAQCALLSPDCADPFSQKSLRAAMGSTYHLPLYMGQLVCEAEKLQHAGCTLLCGHLQGESELPKLQKSIALVIGSEGRGVSDALAAQCELYRLPMRGKAESLNASVAAGVLLYIVSERMQA